jgi:hypothetical protein
MAAIRVRQSRRWVTCRKAYNHQFRRQAQKTAVDNSEDEIRRSLFEKIPNKKLANRRNLTTGRAKFICKGYALPRSLGQHD